MQRWILEMRGGRWSRIARCGLALALAVVLLYVVWHRDPPLVYAGPFKEIQDVTYVERDGVPIKADVRMPEGDGPFPAVLLVHGGGWRSGSKAGFGRIGQELAAAGFTTVTINYRLAPASKFPAQIEDCKAAVRWMRKNAAQYKIDPARIGAVGYSAGGHLVALLGTTDASCGLEGPGADDTSTRLQCVVPGGAPCDFRLVPSDSDRLGDWLGGTRTEKPEVYELASPAKFVTQDDPPMFFFHGGADRVVPIEGVRTMMRTLKEAGVPVQFHLVEGAAHNEVMRDGAMLTAVVKFLNEQLRPAGAAAAAAN